MAVEASLRATGRCSLPRCKVEMQPECKDASSIREERVPGAFTSDEEPERCHRTSSADTDGERGDDASVEEQRLQAYDERLAMRRPHEYPQLGPDTVYLDHAGTTVPSRSLIAAFSDACLTGLYGNPHSGSAGAASLAASRVVEDVRLKVLQCFRADPAAFDVVFVANATAGIKLVADGIRGWARGVKAADHVGDESAKCELFYHADSHTSVVGLREEFDASRCFAGDAEVEAWLGSGEEGLRKSGHGLRLLAYPAQSNMTGRKLPLSWVAASRRRGVYTLLDAAALVPTSPLDMSSSEACADFTVLSFYKMFGMPDLGALIVKKSAGRLLAGKRYFGGGTVEMVTAVKEQWHVRKQGALHEVLEDGTLPVHSIVMLDAAFRAHAEIFGSMEQVQAHTGRLADKLYTELVGCRHWNGAPVCIVYGARQEADYGPTLAFNIKDSRGSWVSNFEVEKLASVRNIQMRVGSVCNPGGITQALDLSPWEMQANFTSGQRCGGDHDIMNGKPTGIIRVSLGAASVMEDIRRFVGFINEFFVERYPQTDDGLRVEGMSTAMIGFSIESLTVYPIKSCAGWTIPRERVWSVRSEGLAWDREWCLVHKGSRDALSQKKHTRMALLRPELDLERGVMTVRYAGVVASHTPRTPAYVTIPLSLDPANFRPPNAEFPPSCVCGDSVNMLIYSSSAVNEFFSTALGTACELARFPAATRESSHRHAKAHLVRRRAAARNSHDANSDASVDGSGGGGTGDLRVPLLLSNESPILVVSRSSLNQLQHDMAQQQGQRQAHAAAATAAAAAGRPVAASLAAAFRANIVLREDRGSGSVPARPYVEDHFRSMVVQPTGAGPRRARNTARDAARSSAVHTHGGSEGVVTAAADDDGDADDDGRHVPVEQAGRARVAIDVLGPCRRCQMVCVDAATGHRSSGGEPFATLAKTRRSHGRVWFGIHAALRRDRARAPEARIRAGDRVEALLGGPLKREGEGQGGG